MNITYWGTRGSLPTIKPETLQYGGNTSCVSISDGNTLLILDAGTGIRNLGDSMIRDMGTFFDIHILLTHFHLDHIQGLGFFKPLFVENLKIHIWGPPSTFGTLRSNISKYMSPPLFPVHLRDLPSNLTISEVPKGPFKIGIFSIFTDFICHPGPTLGYRITEGEKSITYIPDHEPYIGSINFPHNQEWTSGFDLAYKTNLLIHDAQFSPEEYEQKVGWGHSSIQHSIDFARMAEVERLDLFHHDPGRNDEELEAMYIKYVDDTMPIDVFLAKEGNKIVL